MPIGRFERMVGVSEDEYHHLKSLQQSQNPLQGKFLSLSSDYKKQSLINDPSVRVRRQGETLNQMMNVKEDLRKRLTEATPKPYRSRVQSLFQFISDKVNVNDKGELYDSDGKVINDSNIGDLIQHAVRDRRRNMIPSGWNNFLHILRDNNAPRMMLNYDTLDEMQLKTGDKKLKASSSPKKSKPSRLPVPMKKPSVVSFHDLERKPSYWLPMTREKKSLVKPSRTSHRVKSEPDYFNPGTKKQKYV